MKSWLKFLASQSLGPLKENCSITSQEVTKRKKKMTKNLP